jgi:hypothetical protein
MKYAKKMVLVPFKENEGHETDLNKNAEVSSSAISNLLKSEIPIQSKWIKYIGLLKKFFIIADELRKPIKYAIEGVNTKNNKYSAEGDQFHENIIKEIIGDERYNQYQNEDSPMSYINNQSLDHSSLLTDDMSDMSTDYNSIISEDSFLDNISNLAATKRASDIQYDNPKRIKITKNLSKKRKDLIYDLIKNRAKNYLRGTHNLSNNPTKSPIKELSENDVRLRPSKKRTHEAINNDRKQNSANSVLDTVSNFNEVTRLSKSRKGNEVLKTAHIKNKKDLIYDLIKNRKRNFARGTDHVNKTLTEKKNDVNLGKRKFVTDELYDEHKVHKPSKLMKLSNILRGRAVARPKVDTKKRRKTANSFRDIRWTRFNFK